jgi:hypothetical protein
MFKFHTFYIVFVLTGITMLAGFGDSALAQGPCGITIAKVALGGEDTEFPFEHAEDGAEPSFFTLKSGLSTGGPFASTSTVTELPLEGWALVDIECEGTGATGFEITDNGFTATCDGGGFVTCTFFNVESKNIPTLSEWGMIAAAGGLGLIGLFYAVRRKKAAA